MDNYQSRYYELPVFASITVFIHTRTCEIGYEFRRKKSFGKVKLCEREKQKHIPLIVSFHA